MNIEGRTIRLRAVEPGDVDLMYEWENDCDIWPVSGTTEPFSRHQLERFVERHQDIVGVLCDGQLRLIIETLLSSKPVGAIDLFEYDPIHRRAGIGILIYEQSDRGRGYASDAVETLCRYAHDTLRAHQLWCNVGADNEASLRLFRSAGFTEIGVKRDWLWRPDGYHDEVMLQKIIKYAPLIYIPISKRITIENRIYIIIAIPFHILRPGPCIMTMHPTIIIDKLLYLYKIGLVFFN